MQDVTFGDSICFRRKQTLFHSPGQRAAVRQAIDFQLMGVTIDGNNGPGLVLFLVSLANMGKEAKSYELFWGAQEIEESRIC